MPVTSWPPAPLPPGRVLDVVGVGEVMMLLQAVPPETLDEAESMLVDVAGAEFNLVAAVSRLGGRAALLTRLGQDAPGRRIRAAMDAFGIDQSMTISDPEHPTGLLLRDVPADGTRRVHYYRSGSAASTLHRADAEFLWAAPPRAVVLSGLTAAIGPGPRSLVAEVARAAASHGTYVVVDVNLRRGVGDLDAVVATLHAVLPHTDLLVLGDDESEPVLGETAPESVVAAAHDRGVAEVVLKGGSRGCWYQAEDGTARSLPSRAVDVVDPVGAGDAFLGGYLTARLAGAATGPAAELGSELAAGVIAALGDTRGLPDPAAGRRMLAAALRSSVPSGKTPPSA